MFALDTMHKYCIKQFYLKEKPVLFVKRVVWLQKFSFSHGDVVKDRKNRI